MAKSLDTRFAEYVNNCESNLSNILRNKGIATNINDALDALVNRVADITPPPAESEEHFGYVRDANLPDFDAMFDADTDRAVNGGTYRQCAYLVYYLYEYSSTENQQVIRVNGSSNYPVKMVFGKSDREVSITTGNTSNYTFIVDNSEIYTLTTGEKVYLVKLYSNSANGIFYSTSQPSCYALEQIIDEGDNNNYYGGILTTANYLTVMYRRIVAPMSTGEFNNWSLTITTKANGTMRIDGNLAFPSQTASIYIYSTTEIIINGVIIHRYSGTTQPYTYIYLNNGSGSSSGSTQYISAIRKLVIPAISQLSSNYGNDILYFSTSQTQMCLVNCDVYVPDTYKAIFYSVTYGNTSSIGISKLHLPNSINYQATSGSYLFQGTLAYPFLKTLTMSAGAYGLNTSAITLYFDQAPNLTATSLANIVDNLADRTGKTANTVRFSKFQKLKLTAAQITTLQNKNWTVTIV